MRAMKSNKSFFSRVLFAALVALPLAGIISACSSDGYSGSVSYGVGYYDSWGWRGGYYDRPVYIGPSRPITRPTPLPMPVNRPMPRASRR
jgi:hypothetical protein